MSVTELKIIVTEITELQNNLCNMRRQSGISELGN